MKSFNVIYTDGFHRDILELAAFIAIEASRPAADRYIASLVRECETLRWAGYRGTKRTDLRPNLRIIGFKRAVSILFRLEEEAAIVVVLGISYRGRSLQHILERNE